MEELFSKIIEISTTESLFSWWNKMQNQRSTLLNRGYVLVRVKIDIRTQVWPCLKTVSAESFFGGVTIGNAFKPMVLIF